MADFRTGFLADVFDPVSPAHIRLCRNAMQEMNLHRVLMVLSDTKSISPLAKHKDRWRMLVAACAGDTDLIPVDLPSSSLGNLKKLFPDDKLCKIGALSYKGNDRCPSVEEYVQVLGLYGADQRITDGRVWIRKLFQALTAHRFAHSLAVAGTARHLAALYGEDESKAEQAGLLHDCAKCLPLREMQRIAIKNKLTDNRHVLESGALLHSIVGAFVARSEYGVTDEAVLQAIAYHNTGRAGMSRLAMCVCLGDYIEPNREPFPGLEETRALSEISLEQSLLLSLEMTIDHVCSRGRYLHPWTSEAASWLRSLSSDQSSVIL